MGLDQHLTKPGPGEGRHRRKKRGKASSQKSIKEKKNLGKTLLLVAFTKKGTQGDFSRGAQGNTLRSSNKKKLIQQKREKERHSKRTSQWEKESARPPPGASKPTSAKGRV